MNFSGKINNSSYLWYCTTFFGGKTLQEVYLALKFNVGGLAPFKVDLANWETINTGNEPDTIDKIMLR